MSDLKTRTQEARARFEKMCANPVSLDITRGKPAAAQLDLSRELMTVLGPDDFTDGHGNDCRNYGVPDGLPEARALFGELLDVPASEVLIGENSSLTMMHDAISAAVLHGVPGGDGPWHGRGVKILCPVPGYDRHFALTEHLGLGMVPVDVDEDGFDIEAIARLAGDDASVRGVWIVPKYQNPVGCTLGEDAVRALATMKTASPDFRILWDNAYVVHHIEDALDPLPDILAACSAAGNPDRVLIFGSTSKITFAGGGISAFGGSPANADWMRTHRGLRTIGGDKINQLRHVRFFGDADGVRAHMKKHAALLRPEVRGGAPRSRRAARRDRARDVDQPEGRLLRQPRHPGREGQTRVRTRRPGRREAHPRGRDLPVRRRPARSEHPHRADAARSRRARARDHGAGDRDPVRERVTGGPEPA